MARYKTIRVPQLAWYGDTELELRFPSSWDAVICPMKGHDATRLGEWGIRLAFSNPIGTRPIRELAKGKKEVVVLFDDMSRPTKAFELIPYILEELEAGGISDEGIRFIAALGTHGTLTRIDFAKKLGEAVLDRFPVYNHNPYENCTYLGKTSFGTPVSINSEVMACDLKIGIGFIVPHPITGFGGGGKIILPGVASLDTIEANHGSLAKSSQQATTVGLGRFDENAARLDVVEATRMAGLDVKIDVIVNARRETVALFMGDPIAEHAEGAKWAKWHYATERPQEADIVIANAYSKGNESMLALPVGAQLLKDGGDLVLIANTPEGQISHYLLRTFGRHISGRLWQQRTLPPNVRRLIVFAPYMDKAGADWIGPPESILWAKTWDKVLDELIAGNGPKARVAVIPDGTIQYIVPS